MILFLQNKKATFSLKALSVFILLAFVLSTFTVYITKNSDAYASALPYMPAPTKLIDTSYQFYPATLKGIRFYPDNPFKFDFILDEGDTTYSDSQLKEETGRLLEYFLTGLTVPEEDLWVNLSPHEKDRIIPQALSKTLMGRDMLGEDYVLKQLASSLTYPQGAIGKQFWAKVHEKSKKLYGTTNIPMDTFNKVWIVPEEAIVYEEEEGAFLGERRFKVMMESDYVAQKQNIVGARRAVPIKKHINKLSAQIAKEIIVPLIEEEVNHGAQFAHLRQIYDALILATWFKRRLRQSVGEGLVSSRDKNKNILDKIYFDQNKIKGIEGTDPQIKEKIYNQYVEAYKKGVYNFIKSERLTTGKKINRRYYSGGVQAQVSAATRDEQANKANKTAGDGGFGTIVTAKVPPILSDDDTAEVSVKMQQLISSRCAEMADIVKLRFESRFNGGRVSFGSRRTLGEELQKMFKKFQNTEQGDTVSSSFSFSSKIGDGKSEELAIALRWRLNLQGRVIIFVDICEDGTFENNYFNRSSFFAGRLEGFVIDSKGELIQKDVANQEEFYKSQIERLVAIDLSIREMREVHRNHGSEASPREKESAGIGEPTSVENEVLEIWREVMRPYSLGADGQSIWYKVLNRVEIVRKQKITNDDSDSSPNLGDEVAHNDLRFVVEQDIYDGQVAVSHSDQRELVLEEYRNEKGRFLDKIVKREEVQHYAEDLRIAREEKDQESINHIFAQMALAEARVLRFREAYRKASASNITNNELRERIMAAIKKLQDQADAIHRSVQELRGSLELKRMAYSEELFDVSRLVPVVITEALERVADFCEGLQGQEMSGQQLSQELIDGFKEISRAVSPFVSNSFGQYYYKYTDVFQQTEYSYDQIAEVFVNYITEILIPFGRASGVDMKVLERLVNLVSQFTDDQNQPHVLDIAYFNGPIPTALDTGSILRSVEKNLREELLYIAQTEPIIMKMDHLVWSEKEDGRFYGHGRVGLSVNGRAILVGAKSMDEKVVKKKYGALLLLEEAKHIRFPHLDHPTKEERQQGVIDFFKHSSELIEELDQAALQLSETPPQRPAPKSMSHDPQEDKGKRFNKDYFLEHTKDFRDEPGLLELVREELKGIQLYDEGEANEFFDYIDAVMLQYKDDLEPVFPLIIDAIIRFDVCTKSSPVRDVVAFLDNDNNKEKRMDERVYKIIDSLIESEVNSPKRLRDAIIERPFSDYDGDFDAVENARQKRTEYIDLARGKISEENKDGLYEYLLDRYDNPSYPMRMRLLMIEKLIPYIEHMEGHQEHDLMKVLGSIGYGQTNYNAQRFLDIADTMIDLCIDDKNRIKEDDMYAIIPFLAVILSNCPVYYQPSKGDYDSPHKGGIKREDSEDIMDKKVGIVEHLCMLGYMETLTEALQSIEGSDQSSMNQDEAQIILEYISDFFENEILSEPDRSSLNLGGEDDSHDDARFLVEEDTYKGNVVVSYPGRDGLVLAHYDKKRSRFEDKMAEEELSPSFFGGMPWLEVAQYWRKREDSLGGPNYTKAFDAARQIENPEKREELLNYIRRDAALAEARGLRFKEAYAAAKNITSKWWQDKVEWEIALIEGAAEELHYSVEALRESGELERVAYDKKLFDVSGLIPALIAQGLPKQLQTDDPDAIEDYLRGKLLKNAQATPFMMRKDCLVWSNKKGRFYGHTRTGLSDHGKAILTGTKIMDREFLAEEDSCLFFLEESKHNLFPELDHPTKEERQQGAVDPFKHSSVLRERLKEAALRLGERPPDDIVPKSMSQDPQEDAGNQELSPDSLMVIYHEIALKLDWRNDLCNDKAKRTKDVVEALRELSSGKIGGVTVAFKDHLFSGSQPANRNIKRITFSSYRALEGREGAMQGIHVYHKLESRFESAVDEAEYSWHTESLGNLELGKGQKLQFTPAEENSGGVDYGKIGQAIRVEGEGNHRMGLGVSSFPARNCLGLGIQIQLIKRNANPNDLFARTKGKPLAANCTSKKQIPRKKIPKNLPPHPLASLNIAPRRRFLSA
ncbi:MAG: hypothetical protein GY858_02680 [Candidatus Omnitrophica bacterium]|nr:hypothetical protein [Candidatus Omnitrophota bacterium]